MSRRLSSRRRPCPRAVAAAAAAATTAALPNPVRVQSVLCRSPTYADLSTRRTTGDGTCRSTCHGAASDERKVGKHHVVFHRVQVNSILDSGLHKYTRRNLN